MSAPGAAATLVGRTEELARLRYALNGDSCVIVGEPGIGKTTVWHAGVEEQRRIGALVLTASPAQAEQQFSYAVLADLIEAESSEFAVLPRPQQRALEQALLLSDDEGPVDPHLVSVSVRTLLRHRADGRRLVIAIDDIQWADEASLAALAFTLRRASDVTLLASARVGYRMSLPIKVESVSLDGLSPGATHHLIVEHLGRSLPRPALMRVHDISRGNPFFALELARVAQPGGQVHMPDSLRELLIERVNALPESTRASLAKAALSGRWDGDVAPAIATGLVSEQPMRFTHPLYAEAAVEQVDPAARRRMHREIAEAATTPSERAHHLALAATGPDAAVAAQLDSAATESARRGAVFEAAGLWRSAADLTPADDELRKIERLVEHGVALLFAGSPDEADRVLAQNLPLLPPSPLRDRGLIHRALLLARTDSRAVIPVLERVLADVTEPQVRHEVVGLLASWETTVGRGSRGTRLVHEHVRWVEQHAPEYLTPAFSLAAAREALEDRPPWQFFERAETAKVSTQTRPAWGWAMHATALMREDRWDDARASMAEFGVEPAATVYQESSRQLSLAIIELAAGNLAAARLHADEVLCIGEQIDAPYMRCQGHVAVAEAATLQGDLSGALSHATAALTLAESVHAELFVNVAYQALGLLHLSTGDTTAAATAYAAVTDDGYEHYSAFAGGRGQLDAIEALTAMGDYERSSWLASKIPADVWERAVADALLSAAGGQVDEAVARLRAAPTPWSPFRRGRNQLLEGRWLRMLRQRSAARDVLATARQTFEAIGACPWMARADDEIGRLGGRRSSGCTLTDSERRVAELVASGLSNKEVASRLVVSQRTVELHLTKIYAKLEVSSRTALASRWPLD